MVSQSPVGGWAVGPGSLYKASPAPAPYPLFSLPNIISSLE